MRWRSVDAGRLALRELDDDVVVFNDATGNTHLLEPLAAEVLRTLLSAPHGLTSSEVAARLAQGEEEEKDWASAIESTLLEFQRLGLAAPAD